MNKRISFVCALITFAALLLYVWGPFQKRPFLRIPILFLGERPCVLAKIENKEYLFELDSGSPNCFSMQQEVLDKIKNKTAAPPRSWSDINGNNYISPSFTIKDISIESFEMWNVPAFREEKKFVMDGCKVIKQPFQSNGCIMHQGRIGARALRILDYWLINFPKSEIVAIRDIEKIKRYPEFSFDEFVEVSLDPKEIQLIILAETDFGVKRLALDTGAWRSVLDLPSAAFSDHQSVKTNQLVISNQDLGGMEFYLYKLPEDFKVDGILGLDFFQKHAIYLDFKNNRAFIKK